MQPNHFFFNQDLQHQNDILVHKESELMELKNRIAELESRIGLDHQIAMNAHGEGLSMQKAIEELEHDNEHKVDIVVHLQETINMMTERMEELEQKLEQQSQAAIHLNLDNQELTEQLERMESRLDYLNGHLKKYTEVDLSDLKIVEGIGPKIEEALKEAGIHDLYMLAEKDSANIKSIFNEMNRFNLAEPSTWPDQAKMAVEGKMDELKAWQDELDGGRVVEKKED